MVEGGRGKPKFGWLPGVCGSPLGTLRECLAQRGSK